MEDREGGARNGRWLQWQCDLFTCSLSQTTRILFLFVQCTMAKNHKFVMVLGKSSIGVVCWPITRFYIVLLQLNLPTLKHLFWVHTLLLFSWLVKTPLSLILIVAEGEHHFFVNLKFCLYGGRAPSQQLMQKVERALVMHAVRVRCVSIPMPCPNFLQFGSFFEENLRLAPWAT